MEWQQIERVGKFDEPCFQRGDIVLCPKLDNNLGFITRQWHMFRLTNREPKGIIVSSATSWLQPPNDPEVLRENIQRAHEWASHNAHLLG